MFGRAYRDDIAGQIDDSKVHLNSFNGYHRGPADMLVAAVASGQSALVLSSAATGSLLDALEILLGRPSTHILRVRAPDIIANLVNHALSDYQTGRDRLILLVQDAHLLSVTTIEMLDRVLSDELEPQLF